MRKRRCAEGAGSPTDAAISVLIGVVQNPALDPYLGKTLAQVAALRQFRTRVAAIDAGAIPELIHAGFETLVEAGFAPEIATFARRNRLRRCARAAIASRRGSAVSSPRPGSSL